MKKFKFSLSKVLEVRQIEEEQAQLELIKAHQKAREYEEELERLNELQKQLYRFLRNKNLSIEENILARNYLQHNRQQINLSNEKLHTQQEKVVECRSYFLEKRKEKEALEKLKDKRYQAYWKEILNKEQKVTDELALRSKGVGGLL